VAGVRATDTVIINQPQGRKTMNLLHTMLRVGDLQKSIDFYTKVLGMNLVRTTERPDQGYTLAFVAYGDGNKPRWGY